MSKIDQKISQEMKETRAMLNVEKTLAAWISRVETVGAVKWSR